MFYVDNCITDGQRFELWQNALVAEKKLKMQRKLGRWLANPTKKANEHNLPSVFMTAVARLSEKFSIKRKSNQENSPSLFFIFLLSKVSICGLYNLEWTFDYS